MTTDVFELPVHPAAEKFPMLPDDELQELAADIKTNGLKEPIVVAEVNGETVLVDGRNRREACRLAEVAPSTRQLNGEDPVAFILSSNIHRRHMTKGQRAMAVAMIYPDPAKLKRGSSLPSSEQAFSQQYLSQARAVLKHKPEVARDVLNGHPTLADAFKDVQDEMKESDGEQEKRKKLAKEAPDFYRRMMDNEISLDEALTLLDQRRAQERSIRSSVMTAMREALNGLAAISKSERASEMPQWLDDEDTQEEFKRHFRKGAKEALELLTDAGEGLAVLTKVVSEISTKRRGK